MPKKKPTPLSAADCAAALEPAELKLMDLTAACRELELAGTSDECRELQKVCMRLARAAADCAIQVCGAADRAQLEAQNRALMDRQRAASEQGCIVPGCKLLSNHSGECVR